MNGYELQEKYGITITNHSMQIECSEICICGHHASEHYGRGSAGQCKGCGSYAPIGCHNFTPRDAYGMVWEDWQKMSEQAKWEFQYKRRMKNQRSGETANV